MCETINLNNAIKMPIVGLGTSGSGEDGKNAVKHAIDVGYRHFDCAAIYRNEKVIGSALQEKIADGSVKREDLFIVNKLWATFQRPEHVQEGLQISLQNMGLAYMDLFMMHWTFGLKYAGSEVKSFWEAELDETVDYIDTWKVMEELYKKKLVKSIGICNFNLSQLERLLEHATVIPAVLQIECHPYLDQTELITFCKSKGIVVTAYSPFACPSRPWVRKAGINIFDDTVLQSLAKIYNKSIAQVVIRYLIQQGVCVIPKSVSRERIKANFEVFDFSLSSDSLEMIKGLDCKRRIIPPHYNHIVHHKHFPFPKEELLWM